MSKKPEALTLASAMTTASIVIGGLPELSGYNGAVLLIDDTERDRIVKDTEDAAAELRRLHSLNAELVAQVNALRADAERYQFIKQCSPEPRVGAICPTILLFGLQGYPEDQWNNSALESKNLDAAIDAAKEDQQ